MTSFIGRRADLQSLTRAFAGGRRLVVITGPPGMGKTRLAVELVATRPALGRRARHCDLTHARDTDALCAAVARAIGLGLGEPGQDPVAAIGEALRARGRLLLVLDNFEQLVGAGSAAVQRWCAVAPGLRILATSRERTGIAGEHVHELGPLLLPAGHDAVSSEAGRLFVDRARLCRGCYVPDDAEAAVVAEIVRRLDGMPLAIELCAARMAVMSAPEILGRLEQRFLLLSSSRGGTGSRHATLHGAIAGSWELLPPWGRSALAQCSVFRGGFTLAAAEAVLDFSSHADAPATVDALAVLRDRSLLRATTGCPTSPSELRFDLYESIREFAAEKLAADSRAAHDTIERHAAYFLGRGEHWALDVERGGDQGAIGRLLLERENLGAVLERALAEPGASAGAARRAVRALVALDPLLTRRGPFAAHLQWLDRAVRLAREARVEPALRARALLLRGQARLARARLEEAATDFVAAGQLSRGPVGQGLRGLSLLGLATARYRQGRPGQARPPLERAIALLRGARFSGPEALARSYLGVLALEAGQRAEAREHYERALALVQAPPLHCPDRRLEVMVRLRFAYLGLDEGRVQESRRNCRRALALLEGAPDRRLEGFAHACLAVLFFEERRLQEALRHGARARESLAEVGDAQNEGLALAVEGGILAALGRLQEAEDRMARSAAVLTRVGVPLGSAAAQIYRGHLDLARSRQAAGEGDWEAASAHMAAALRRLAGARDGATGSGPAGSSERYLLTETSSDARVARRVLGQAVEAALRHDAPPREALLIEPDGARFRPPGRLRWVSLARHASLRRILARLCSERLRAPGRDLLLEDLLAAGWPGESVLPASAANRVYVALSGLRKQGLHGLIVTTEQGYRLDPTVPLLLARLPPASPRRRRPRPKRV